MLINPIRVVVAVAVLAFPLSCSPAWAQVAARPAEDQIRMLDSPNRVASLRVDDVIARLGLRPGDVVADLGAGTGVFSLPMARVVGPAGTVYSVEVDQGLVDHIAGRARAESAANVRALLGRFDDPALPARDVTLVFVHDVLHHVAEKAAYVKNAAAYLRPGGRFAVVEFDGDRGPHKGQPNLQVTREQLAGWMSAAGLVLDEEIRMFDDKWFVIYRRPAGAAQGTVTRPAVPGVTNFARLDHTIACAGATTPEAMSHLKDMGFASVINLRQASEEGANVDAEAAAAKAAGLRFVHLPLSGAAPDPAVIDQFLAAIADPANGPAFIHCASGNRAAAMWMVKRVKLDGWTIDAAGREAADLGLTSGALRDRIVTYLEGGAR